MSPINTTDIIYATITRLSGKIIATIRMSGITDLASILRVLRRQLPEEIQGGLVTVNIRNSSAGWNQTSRVMLRR